MNRPLSRIPRIGAAIGADHDTEIETELSSIRGDELYDAMEAELDEIEGDIEAAEEPWEVGAVQARAGRLAAKTGRLQARAASGGRGSGRAQAKLLRIAQRQERAFARLARKQDRLAQLYGTTPGAVGGLGVQGINQRARISSQSAAYAEAGQIGQMRRTAFSGTEVRVPFLTLDSTPHPAKIVNAAATTAASYGVTMRTENIPYASFLVRGLDCTIKLAKNENASGFPQQKILWNLFVKKLQVDGSIDLLYPGAAGIPVEFSAMGVDGTFRSSIALRSNPVLDKTNRVSIDADFDQEIADNEAEYWASISFAVVGEILEDRNAQNSF